MRSRDGDEGGARACTTRGRAGDSPCVGADFPSSTRRPRSAHAGSNSLPSPTPTLHPSLCPSLTYRLLSPPLPHTHASCLQVNYELIELLVAHVHSSREYDSEGAGRAQSALGAVLVFLPGMAEIQVAVRVEQ